MKKLILLAVLFAMAVFAFADVITIGTGTSYMYEPIASYYGYHRSAAIYTAGQVGGSGTINTISFKAYNTTTTSIPIKVYMKMTTASTLAPAANWGTLTTGLSTLYEGTFSGTTAGAWKTITLTTPFSYTGNNLMILIESNYGGGGTSGPQWYYTTASNQNQYIRKDTTAPTTETGTVNGNLPNVQLDISGYTVFAPSFAVTPTSVAFGNVIMNTTTAYTNVTVSNNGAGTLNISSVSLGGTDSSRFLLDMNSNPTPWALTAGQSKTIKVAFNPIAAASYSAYLRFAGDAKVDHDVTITGTGADPTIVSYPYTENFDTLVTPALPFGWSITEGTTGATQHWKTVSTAAHGPTAAASASNFAHLYCYLASTAYNPYSLITPPVNLPAQPKRMVYKYWIGDDSEVNPLFVDVSTDLNTWTTLYTHDNSANTLAWYVNTIDLTAYASSTVYLRFRGVSNYGNDMTDFGLDDIMIEDIPAGAPDPVTLNYPAAEATGLPKAGFNLTWTPALTGGAPDDFTVFVSTDPDDVLSQFSASTTGNSLNPVGMPYESETFAYVYGQRYYWQVFANGGGFEVASEIRWFTIQDDPTIVAFPYDQNFDGVTIPTMPAGWSTINSGAGNWVTAANVTPYSTPNSAVVYYNSSLPKDEWMISPPVAMQAGVGYNVRFQLKAPGYSGIPEQLAVFVGTEPTVASLTANTALYDDPNLLQSTYTEIVIPYTPTTAGSYYFGWHAYSEADVDYISIDDVRIELQPLTPVFELTPATEWAFGEVELANPGVKNFQIKNVGIGTLNVASTDISITNDAESDFSITAPDLPVALGPNDTYTFTVTFTPSTVGEKTATLNVMDTYLTVNNEVALSGTAIPEPIGNVVNVTAVVQSNVNVALNWGIAYGTPGTPAWMNWDNGIYSHSIGTGAATTFAVASKFTAGDLYNYQGMQITKLKFIPTSATATYTLKIWTGNDIDLAPVTEVYSEAIASPTVGAYNEITLATPYVVPAGTAVYYGYSVVETGTAYPAGADAGPAVVGKGNLIYWNSVWQELSNLNAALIYNWNIQAYADVIPVRVANVVKDRTPRPIAVYNAPMTRESMRNNLVAISTGTYPSRVLRGFNIFRDDVLINPTLVATTSYLDVDLAPATYSYTVQAVYYSQNSAVSAPASVSVVYIPPIELPFTEDWASNLFTTNNWVAGASNWNNYSSLGNPSPTARFSWNPQVTDYSIPLTSFAFNGVGHDAIKLAFDLSLDNYSTDAINQMSVEVWDGTTWNTVDTFSCEDYDGAGWGFIRYFYDISAYAANREFKVRFLAFGEDSFEIDYWYLDNIQIAALVAPTTAPVVTIAPSATAGSVTLSWGAVENADWYSIYAGDTPETLSFIGYTPGGLTMDIVAEAKKFFQVRAGAGSLPAGPRIESNPLARTRK